MKIIHKSSNWFICLFCLLLSISLKADISSPHPSNILTPQVSKKTAPEPFSMKRIIETDQLYRAHQQKEYIYSIALKKVVEISESEIASTLNDDILRKLFNPDEEKKEVKTEDLNILYAVPSKEKFIHFIEEHNLRPVNILMILIPLLRSFSLPEQIKIETAHLPAEDIISIMEQTKLDINTEITIGDLITVFLDFPKNYTYIDSNEILTSLGHLLALTKDQKLVEYLYTNKDFNPNATDILEMTPLHTLVFSSIQKNMSVQEWKNILEPIRNNQKTDFNTKDLHGQTPIALAATVGSFEALQAMLQQPNVDLYVKDHYGRSLAILSSLFQNALSKQKAQAIINKGGDDTVALSFLNEYLTEDLQLVRLQSIHPLAEALSRSSMLLSEKGLYDQETMEKLKNYIERLNENWINRTSMITSMKVHSSLLHPTDNSKVMNDIEYDNIQSLEENKELYQQLLGNVWTSLEPTSESPTFIKNHNLLLHAILSNAPNSVEFLMNHITNPEIFTPSSTFSEAELNQHAEIFSIPESENVQGIVRYMDPLTEALVLSSLILQENWEEDKNLTLEKNSKIIQTILKDEKTDLLFKNFIDLTPIETAIITGQLDVVKYLHEEKGIPIPKEGLWNTGMSYADLAVQMEFYNMAKYMVELEKEKPASLPPSSCQTPFLH